MRLLPYQRITKCVANDLCPLEHLSVTDDAAAGLTIALIGQMLDVKAGQDVIVYVELGYFPNKALPFVKTSTNAVLFLSYKIKHN